MGDELSQFKKEVKHWLKLQGLGYSWLAEQCGVSEITVRNWMSQKNIPPLKKQLVAKAITCAADDCTSPALRSRKVILPSS